MKREVFLAMAMLVLMPIISMSGAVSQKSSIDVVPPDLYEITRWHTFDGSLPTLYIARIYGLVQILPVRTAVPASQFMIVLVNSTLYPNISAEINRYADDVEETGLGVAVCKLFSGSPTDVRNFLAQQGSALKGCLLVGDIPEAWYEMDTQWHPLPNPAEHEEFPMDLFYMDLDGTWTDTDSDGLYNTHTGNVAPDIWVGRLKADNMVDPEISLIKNYFDKNHAYRTGSLTCNQRALVYVDDDWASASGIISNSVGTAYSTRTVVNDKATTNKTDYMTSLTQSWSLVQLSCHGSSGSHGFKIPNATNPSQSIYEGVGIEGKTDVRNADPDALFYNLFVCSGGRFTSPNCVGSWYILTQNHGLATVASTKTGSMYPDKLTAFYEPLGQGKIMGDAFKQWFTTWGEVQPEWHYGMVLLGDPTLRTSGKHTVTINTPGLDSASNIVHYTKDGAAKDGSITEGTWSDECDHGTTLTIENTITTGGSDRIFTADAYYWTIVEPETFTVNYYDQYKPTVSTGGLPSSSAATVQYQENGLSKSKTDIWDGNSFSEWCDATSTLSITNPVNVKLGERYYSIDQTSWTVTSDFSATVNYFHQYHVDCAIATEGAGHTDLDASNHVTISYTQSGSSATEDTYDAHSLSDWVDALTSCDFENPSSASTSNHRWCTSASTNYAIYEPTTITLTYFEQFYTGVSSSGGLLTSSYEGETNYTKFGTSLTGNYWDGHDWEDYCDIGSTLTASQIVLGPTNERHHTPDTVSWTVTESTTHNLAYHKEYKITLKAEGLPDTTSTVITIGTADPSISDEVGGGDITSYDLTLDSSSLPPFTWTNWIHADTSLTATGLIAVSSSEKYILVCWTRDGLRLAPPTIYAEMPGLAYSAEYAGVKKNMSPDQADLCDPIIVTIEISDPPAGNSNDKVYVADDLPNEQSFVQGTAKIDSVPYTPTIEIVSTPVIHQRVKFTVDGFGKHVITFEARVNRAYATDTAVDNSVAVTFTWTDLPDAPLSVVFETTIHPYVGPTLSKATDGPAVVPIFTKVGWVFTYIVKNNPDYAMVDPTLKDRFGAELEYNPNTVIANLLTDPQFSSAKGMGEQVRLLWDLPSLTQGEAFMLQVTLNTGKNPSISQQQEYTSPGMKILNSGAALKWLDQRAAQQSLATPVIYVEAVGQIYGYVKDQYGKGVAGAIVELYYEGRLLTTAATDSTGQYNFVTIGQSGTYTIKIKSLPPTCTIGLNPSQKTAAYTLGQTNPTSVSFTVNRK